MYKITQNEIEGFQFLELSSPDNKAKAVFCLNQGGRLAVLEFDGVNILADYPPDTYTSNYASSILFPFANRIKDGKFHHEGKEHILFCNETEKNNALHGLVYDKLFECTKTDLTSDYGTLTLKYDNQGDCKGFPYKFQIDLKYTLTEDNFRLEVNISNADDQTFPFTLGWHPYFSTADLKKSTLVFDGHQKYHCDEQQVVSGASPFDLQMPLLLKDLKFDDGFSLKSGAVEFITPKFKLDISSSSHENYLQLYTPPTPDIIAIEPMTGVADSFNNKIGLQTLAPEKTYSVHWNISFQKMNSDHKTNPTTTSLCNS